MVLLTVTFRFVNQDIKPETAEISLSAISNVRALRERGLTDQQIIETKFVLNPAWPALESVTISGRDDNGNYVMEKLSATTG